jgi:hypothetical protein
MIIHTFTLHTITLYTLWQLKDMVCYMAIFAHPATHDCHSPHKLLLGVLVPEWCTSVQGI